MENFSSTSDSRSSYTGSGKVARSCVACEVGPNSEDVSVSSGCNVIAGKTKIQKLVNLQLIEYFGESKKREDNDWRESH